MAEITNASRATEKGKSFLLEKYPLRGRVARPMRATLKDKIWTIEFNVGIVRVLIATIKIDAINSKIIEYNIPPVADA